ncbi:MAG: hypothetical protein IKO15_02525 [Clostridiales bacterium]|nr:hypothetical protein [Clostridiales bacterium]
MIKRLRKFRQSKQGAILVMVVLILALAMIFIASAMMLTQATRGRLYKNTMASQARLTVTTAAEVFLEALETQEITDAQLDAILLGTEDEAQPRERHLTNEGKIKMLVDGVPGMSSDGHNCTYLDLYFPNTSNLDLVYADFTTIIGDETENVRIKLAVGGQDPSYGSRFSNQIDIDSDVGDRTLFFKSGMGMTTLTDLDDNTVLVRGTSKENATGSVFYSDFIFTGDAQFTAGSNRYNGNMVFLDGAHMKGGAAIGGYFGDLYFISKNDSGDAGLDYTDDGGWNNISAGSKLIFSGRTVENNGNSKNNTVSNVVSSRSCYFVDSNGSTVASTQVQAWHDNLNASGNKIDYYVDNATHTDANWNEAEGHESDLYLQVAKNVKNYRGYGYTDGSDPFPSSIVSVLMDIKSSGSPRKVTGKLDHDEYTLDGDYLPWKDSTGQLIEYSDEYTVAPNPLTKEFPLRAADGSVDSKYVLDISSSNLATLASGEGNRVIYMDDIDTAKSNNTGYYLLTTDGDAVETSDDKPYLIMIDGGKKFSGSNPKYRFYFEGGESFNLWSVVFVIYNVDDEYTPTIFVMEPNAKVHMGGSNSSGTPSLCSAGFITINRNTGDKSLEKYILDGPIASSNDAETQVWSSSFTNLDNNVIRYSKYYDGEKQPAAYIFGSGDSCEFYAHSGAIIEAYIGLYDGGKFGGANEHLDDTLTYIYGRIECSKLKMGNSNGNYCMPYCPRPKSDDTKPIKRTAGSKYSVNDIVYYYQEATPEDDG